MADKKIRVLHFSSRDEECGVAKYLEQYIRVMASSPEVSNEYFGTSPYQLAGMPAHAVQKMADQLRSELKSYDILHVQHEFSFYPRDSFRKIIEAGKRSGKKVIITMHISPTMHGGSKEVRLHGLGPRSVMQLLRAKRGRRFFFQEHIEPFRMADLILAHNAFTADSLQKLGVRPERIKRIFFPVQVFDTPPKTSVIGKNLNKRTGDVIYCAVGFQHKYKGLSDAVRALKFLPANYKLAILGGIKSDSDDPEFYNKLCDLIDTLGLQERVYISGYIQSDDELNGLIRECDVCIYPYDRVYYANVSSSSLNLAFANDMPAIGYPTNTFAEVNSMSNGAIVLCKAFAYYELARELRHIDLEKQTKLSKKYAEEMAWPKQTKVLIEIYKDVVQH